MAYTFTHLLTHIVFNTKDRAPLLDADLKPRLFAYMGASSANSAVRSC